MEMIVVLLIGVPFAIAIWLIARAISARNRIEELTRRLGDLEREFYCRKKDEPLPAPAVAAVPIVPPVGKPVPAPAKGTAPPPCKPAPIPPLAPPPQPKPAINWEQFMGVKGFAWLGGFALFLGVAFFIKYSFDNNLVPPELRVAIGFLTGLGLLVGGVVMSRKNYGALSKTLCATGVVVLYAVTFACRSIYHFEFFTPIVAFLLMALITATAFTVAARLNALVVAILGMLGGFLTPILLSTGQDNPLGLFAYITILDTGLILVALRKRWHFLTTLAALGTALLQIGWADSFFVLEKYFEGDKIFIALVVLLGFNLLWLAANWFAKRRAQSNLWLASGNLGLAAVALAFTAFFFTFAPLAARPVLLFNFVFLIDLAIAALARLDGKVAAAQPIAGLAVFGLLALWTANHLTNELLNPALAFYFLFAAFHSGLPAFLQRRDPTAPAGAKLAHFFPPLALLLVLVPIFKLQELSFLVWPFVLLVDLLAIALAALTAALWPVLIVLLLTLAATGALIFKIPANLTGLPTSFWLLGAFAVFFVTASVWLIRKIRPDTLKSGLKLSGNIAAPETLAATLPAASAALPFLLLIMATLRLPLANPSPIFGLALLLAVLLLGLTVLFGMESLPVVALAGVFALECAWHFNRLDVTSAVVAPTLPLTWYLVFLGVFAVFPFLFLKKFTDKTLPWAAAALAGPAQFLLVFRLVKVAWPNSTMGLLPAAFAVPALLSLVVVLKMIPAENKARLTQLAWFGGVGLFFITLIFPIQFDRQWITLSWALEGAALLWLFQRVPHPGLRLAGFGLLVAAFARLTFNPAVFSYHTRAATPIFNWYLYTYGITTACLFAGARLLAPPRNVIMKTNVQPLLAALGTVLAFLLMNIEIADYFTAAGERVRFLFGGNFARTMTYTIAWALFALVMIVIGIVKKLPAARYAAMALLCVTLLKLFFHDLASLNQLYRIGAFIGVAVIAMLASFAYQKFFSATAKTQETSNENPK